MFRDAMCRAMRWAKSPTDAGGRVMRRVIALVVSASLFVTGALVVTVADGEPSGADERADARPAVPETYGLTLSVTGAIVYENRQAAVPAENIRIVRTPNGFVREVVINASMPSATGEGVAKFHLNTASLGFIPLFFGSAALLDPAAGTVAHLPTIGAGPGSVGDGVFGTASWIKFSLIPFEFGVYTLAWKLEPSSVPPGWSTCPGSPSTICTTLDVPVDYADPDGAQIAMAVEMYQAEGADPVGSVVVNLGGPGVAGVGSAAALVENLPKRLRERFNIVTFDPRGTGQSRPIICDATFPTAAAIPTLIEEWTAFGAACLRDNPETLGHVGTYSVVRDVDRLRAALGDEKLTYLGYSYGTLLGAQYGETYPEKIRAMVLDGATNPADTLLDRFTEMAIGRKLSFDRFLYVCGSHPDCPYYSDGRPSEAFDELLASLFDGTPEQQAVAVQLLAFIATGMYAGEDAYGNLAQVIADTPVNPDTQGARAHARRLDRAKQDFESEHELVRDMTSDSGAAASLFAINCLDYETPSLDEFMWNRARRLAEAPRMGMILADMGISCLNWPVAPTGKAAPIAAAGSPPIVVVGALYDPATPLVSSLALYEQLDDSRLIVVDSAAHASFGVNVLNLACLDDPVVDYLVDLVAPRDGIFCTQPDIDPFAAPVGAP